MKTYRVTIERVETTIIEVEAVDKDSAEIEAWKVWSPDKFGLADTTIVDMEEV